VIQSVPIWLYAVGFLLLLGPLVTVHELGHYLVGRWCGVKADAFSIGFGKEIAGFTDRRGTRWRMSLLPLGGYVQFAGDMNPTGQPSAEWLALPPEERAQTFQAHPLWQRALIVAAGPLTNLLLAVAILAGFNLAYGKIVIPPRVGEVAANSAAAQAGLKPGDLITAVGNQPISDYLQMREEIATNPGGRIALTFERDGRVSTVDLTLRSEVEHDRFGNRMQVGRLGVRPVNQVSRIGLGPLPAVGLAVEQTGNILRLTVRGLGQILSGNRPLSELGGPVRMAKFSGEQLSLGPLDFIQFVAFVSINLAFINALPIPALDGGHLAFYAAEAVRRKPLDQRSQEWAFRTGIAFVLALMLFVTINDIVSLPIFGR
jgi:regulator of sigma E protease